MTAVGCRAMLGRAVSFFVIMLVGILPLRGQTMRIIPREVLDSLANPRADACSPMQFEQTRMDMGTLSEDDAPVSGVFRWKNTGGQPLRVLEAATGCSCISAEFDRSPVPAGGTGSVTLTWHPKGHPGPFLRKIPVYCDSGGAPAAVLELTGKVTPSVRPVHDYPFSLGHLLLKRTQVSMTGKERCIESIEVMNGGESPLQIEADERLLPPFISVECRPQLLQPGDKADIEVRFDPAGAALLPERVPVLLKGLPAGRNKIYVVFEKDIRYETQ